ncbi:hypothetical protein [Anaerotignum sp.]
MTNKKNAFFTLFFSCCPGAGEMYMGLYKQGIGLMGLFFGTAALAAWLRWEELLLFLCPIVWCYSFFHTHNLRRMTEEEFAAVEDKFFFEDYVDWERDWQFTAKHRRIFGIVLLLMGISVLWRAALNLVGYYFNLPGIFWELSRCLPQVIMAVVVLCAALHLMREPKGDEEESMEEDAEEAEAV